MNDSDKTLAVFQGKNEWWFSVFDIVSVLADSADPKQYVKKMRSRDPVLNVNRGTFCTPLEILAPDGKKRETNCVNTEGAFRFIQSIPSPKAEPFKLWLAKVGYDRVKEIENPELAQKRMKELYKAKGYSDDWIEKRVRGIVCWLVAFRNVHYMICRFPADYAFLPLLGFLFSLKNYAANIPSISFFF